MLKLRKTAACILALLSMAVSVSAANIPEPNEVIKGQSGELQTIQKVYVLPKMESSDIIPTDEFTEDKVKYEDLTKAGIALEFLMEGPVDDNFIEAYSFVLTRNSIWHIKQIRNIISPLDRNALLKAECINPSTTVRSYNYKKTE